MDTLDTAVAKSSLTRDLANIFVFLVLLGCAGIVGYQLIMGLPINPVIWGILTTGFGMAVHSIAVNQGVTLMPIAKVQATPPLSPDPTPIPGQASIPRIAQLVPLDQQDYNSLPAPTSLDAYRQQQQQQTPTVS